MVCEINYATDNFKDAQMWHVKVARSRGGYDKVIAYTPADLDEDFVNRCQEILSYKKGGGYWIWKPHIINMTLRKLTIGDYLFYCDSGALIRHPIHKLIDVMEKNKDDIMVFEVYDHKEKYWTKRDVFLYFNYETDGCLNSNQIMSGFILIKKTQETVRIFQEYEEACLHGRMITDSPNETGIDNYIGFCEHRHDQSILSVLLKKNGVRPYRDPSQYGMYQQVRYWQGTMSKKERGVYKRSKYPLFMFLLHRSGNIPGKANRWFLHRYKDIIWTYLSYWCDKDKLI